MVKQGGIEKTALSQEVLAIMNCPDVVEAGEKEVGGEMVNFSFAKLWEACKRQFNPPERPEFFRLN